MNHLIIKFYTDTLVSYFLSSKIASMFKLGVRNITWYNLSRDNLIIIKLSKRIERDGLIVTNTFIKISNKEA